MREPQRKFVVEFKTRSRQAKASKPLSIWGDTDLRAVARQVEEQSGHLFPQPDDQPITGAEAVNILAGSSPTAEPTAGAAADKMGTFTATETGSEVDEAVSVSEYTRSRSTKGGLRKQIVRDTSPVALRIRQGRATSKRRIDNVNMPEVATPDTSVTRGDLIELDAENLRLKAELRAKLVAQNEMLKRMLVRLS